MKFVVPLFVIRLASALQTTVLPAITFYSLFRLQLPPRTRPTVSDRADDSINTNAKILLIKLHQSTRIWYWLVYDFQSKGMVIKIDFNNSILFYQKKIFCKSNEKRFYGNNRHNVYTLASKYKYLVEYL